MLKLAVPLSLLTILPAPEVAAQAAKADTKEALAARIAQLEATVAKLAAMLRVAVALDDSRSQRIKDFQCVREEGRLVIAISQVRDLSLEQLALRQNGSLFEEIFGMPVLLRTQREDKR